MILHNDVRSRLVAVGVVVTAHILILGGMAIAVPPVEAPPPLTAIDVELFSMTAPAEVASSSATAPGQPPPPAPSSTASPTQSRATEPSLGQPASPTTEQRASMLAAPPQQPLSTAASSPSASPTASPSTASPTSHAPSTTRGAPPQPQAASPARMPTGPRAGPASATYQQILLAHLERHKRYPRAARSHRQQGVATLRFTMDRQGRVLSARLVSSAGHGLLDREALAMLDRSQPLPAPPPEVPGAVLDLSVPVEFFLN